MNKFHYPAIFQQEETGYSVWIPDLPGCVSQGNSLEEAIEMITDAMQLYLEFSIDEIYNGKQPPEPSNPKDIQIEDNQFIAFVECDIFSYQKKHNNKSVKKTLTIPCWLNELAEENHINFSATLQDAIYRKLNIS